MNLAFTYIQRLAVFVCAIKQKKAPAEKYDFDVKTKKGGHEPVCHWIYQVVARLMFAVVIIIQFDCLLLVLQYKAALRGHAKDFLLEQHKEMWRLTLPERTVVASS